MSVFRVLIGGMLKIFRPIATRLRLCAHSVIAQVVHYVHSRHVISRLWPELEMTGERIEEISTHIADFSLAYLREIAPREIAPREIAFCPGTTKRREKKT